MSHKTVPEQIKLISVKRIFTQAAQILKCNKPDTAAHTCYCKSCVEVKKKTDPIGK